VIQTATAVKPYYQRGSVTLYHGNALDVLPQLGSVCSIVTDPPYGLAFMGQRWDYDVPTVELWQACLDALKPGGHLLAFAGTRTQHRMAVRIEDAGFEIRDMIAWVYGSGFPKSMDVSKAIDKGEGENRARQLQFTAWMRSTGITAKQIKEATNTDMASHYLTDASQPAIATAEMFDKLRRYLPEVPEEIERLVAERTGIEWTAYVQRPAVATKIGRNTKIERVAGSIASQGLEKSTKHEFTETAPATDAAKQWQGWGTALKPALEPITMARKPFRGTVAANVLEHGTGAINVDECRIHCDDSKGYAYKTQRITPGALQNATGKRHQDGNVFEGKTKDGRWPANLVHDGSDEVLELFPEQTSGANPTRRGSQKFRNTYAAFEGQEFCEAARGADSGSAARFFYCAKASRSERGRDNTHPTVKPLDLMRYLIRLVTPPGGLVLDPFAGSGTTLLAARLEGSSAIGIELEEKHCEIIARRLDEGLAF
jgi:site-specific DNA-methyltransferase (adenine-specific)